MMKSALVYYIATVASLGMSGSVEAADAAHAAPLRKRVLSDVTWRVGRRTIQDAAEADDVLFGRNDALADIWAAEEEFHRFLLFSSSYSFSMSMPPMSMATVVHVVDDATVVDPRAADDEIHGGDGGDDYPTDAAGEGSDGGPSEPPLDSVGGEVLADDSAGDSDGAASSDGGDAALDGPGGDAEGEGVAESGGDIAQEDGRGGYESAGDSGVDAGGDASAGEGDPATDVAEVDGGSDGAASGGSGGEAEVGESEGDQASGGAADSDGSDAGDGREDNGDKDTPSGDSVVNSEIPGEQRSFDPKPASTASTARSSFVALGVGVIVVMASLLDLASGRTL